MHPRQVTFEDAIAPLSPSEFLASYWGRTHLRLRGKPGRFAYLLPWAELNRILESHQLHAPRLRLAQDGKDINENRYLASLEDGSVRVLKPAALANCLHAGATLVLDRVEEMAPAVRELAVDFERALGCHTTVNLYAGWRTQNGFDLHWDSQETMILQLDGRKHWKVFAPTRIHPIENDIEKAEKPTGEPVWEGILEDGDALYMPRGWWHVAYPLDEPSLHLTMTSTPATGVELLGWLVEKMKQNPTVRANVPAFLDSAGRSSYVAQLRASLLAALNDDMLDQFLENLDAAAVTRPRVRLPEQVALGSAPITAQSRVRLALGRRLRIDRAGDLNGMLVVANDQQWRCSERIVPALRALSRDSSHSLAELCAMLPEPADSAALKLFLATLSLTGAIWVE